MRQLIGITGRARAGKDTFARYLAESFGMTHQAFAQPLKQITARLAGEPEAYFHDDELKEQHCPALGMTRRKAMQLVGTEMVREHFGPDVWSRLLIDSWRQGGCRPTVVSDVRFNNEAQAIRAAGGVIVRITRPGAGLVGDVAAHDSEQGVSDYLVDFDIPNNGSRAELFCEVHRLMTILEGAQHG